MKALDNRFYVKFMQLEIGLLMFWCGAEIVPKRSQCEQKPYPLCNLQRSLLI